MNKPYYYVASDYTGLDFKGGSFYFGYEHSICAECGGTNKGEYCDTCIDADRYWCFVAKFNGNEIIIPANKLGTDDMSNITENLITGIGWVLARYNLVSDNEQGE